MLIRFSKFPLYTHSLSNLIPLLLQEVRLAREAGLHHKHLLIRYHGKTCCIGFLRGFLKQTCLYSVSQLSLVFLAGHISKTKKSLHKV